MYLDASLSAGVFNQYDLVEESLRYAANIYAMGRKNQPFEPLVGVNAWAKKDGADPVQASVAVLAAMLAAESADAATAKDLLNQARREMSRNDLKNSPVMTRWHYVAALASYLEGDTKSGDESVSNFLRLSAKNSLKLYQAALADQLVVSGVAGELDSNQLYESVLQRTDRFRLDV